MQLQCRDLLTTLLEGIHFVLINVKLPERLFKHALGIHKDLFDVRNLLVKEIIIPQEFDDVYNQYNIIQKQQNLDLERYKGARVKCWSYNVKNYPGYENSEGVIRANMLIFDGVVIGGDISSTELSGFMHTFDFPQEKAQTTSPGETAA